MLGLIFCVKFVIVPVVNSTDTQAVSSHDSQQLSAAVDEVCSINMCSIFYKTWVS